VVIRRGDVRDHAFVADLGRRVAATSISAVRPAPIHSVELAYDRLLAFLLPRDHVLLVAADGETPLGFLIMLHDLPDEVTNMEQGFVAYMAVEPDATRRGVGAALVACAEEIARAHGLPYLSLMVTEDNAAARALYEGAGFVTERRMMTKFL
jgi:ribosomal protein S18 acetylase RimI-like enzyme